jgi:cAMP-dependent protein kinase regulator
VKLDSLATSIDTDDYETLGDWLNPVETVLLDDQVAPDAFSEIMAQPSPAHQRQLEELVDRLPRFPIFSEVEREVFVRIVQEIDVARFDTGEIILSEGERGDAFYLIAHGSARVVKTGFDAESVDLATLTAGDFFGEFAYLAGTPRSASVVAAEPLEVLRFTRRALATIEQNYPEVRKTLEAFYHARLAQTMAKLSPIFRAIPEEYHADLIQRMRHVLAQPGEVIIRQGDDARSLYFVLAGEVMVEVTADGKTVDVAHLTAGHFFGEIGLLTGKPASATCTALQETRLYELAGDEFRRVAEQFPEVLDRVANIATLRLAENRRRLAAMI